MRLETYLNALEKAIRDEHVSLLAAQQLRRDRPEQAERMYARADRRARLAGKCRERILRIHGAQDVQIMVLAVEREQARREAANAIRLIGKLANRGGE